MHEFSRILTAAGLAIFGVGLTVYGMGTSLVHTGDPITTIGLVLLIGGIIGAIIGGVMYRQTVDY